MAEMKAGYKKTDIGIIPQGWDVASLVSIGTFSKGSGIKKDEAQSGSIPCIRYGELYTKHNDIVRHFYSFISNAVAKKSKKIKKGDILFAGSGETKEEIGKCVAFIGEQVAYAGGDIIILSPHSDNSEFLGYLLNSAKIKMQKSSLGQGDAVVHINSKTLSSILAPIPKPEEQKAIAAALSEVDGLIESLEQLIAKKHDIKVAVMQQFLTGKKRLHGFNGEWSEKRLGDFLNYEQPTKYLVSSTDYIEHGDIVVLTANKSFILGYTDEMNGIFKNVPVIIFDDFTTASKFVDFSFKVKSSALKILKIKGNNANLKFLFERMQLINYHLSNHKRYWISEYQNIRIPVPEKPEQSAIASIISDMDSEIGYLQQRLEKAKALKIGMMQELLTGKTRLVKLPPKTKAQESRSDHFNDAVIIAVLADTFGSQEFPLGRKRYTKLSYLFRRHKNENTENYLKKAAGPYNPKTKYAGAEKIALEGKYIRKHKNGNFDGFISGKKIADAKKYFLKWYGDDALQWLEQFRYRRNDDIEVIATIDMAVQDLLNQKSEINLQQVKTVLQNNPAWKTKLSRREFSDESIGKAIKKSIELFGVSA